MRILTFCGSVFYTNDGQFAFSEYTSSDFIFVLMMLSNCLIMFIHESVIVLSFSSLITWFRWWNKASALRCVWCVWHWQGGRTALGLASRASMIGIVDLLITAERYQCAIRAERLASGLECSLNYHHCFYQTSCSALSAVHSNSCPVSTTQPACWMGITFMYIFIHHKWYKKWKNVFCHSGTED